MSNTISAASVPLLSARGIHKSFGALADLTVPVAGATPRAATTADVTHVRWLWTDAVAPGSTRSVAFFGKVK